MKTNADYTLDYMDYGEITVPKGTLLTHKTAMGIDKTYHFVDEYDWIDKDYPKISNLLKLDADSYGINVPREYVDYEPKQTHLQNMEKLTQQTFVRYQKERLKELLKTIEDNGEEAINKAVSSGCLSDDSVFFEDNYLLSKAIILYQASKFNFLDKSTKKEYENLKLFL